MGPIKNVIMVIKYGVNEKSNNWNTLWFRKNFLYQTLDMPENSKDNDLQCCNQLLCPLKQVTNVFLWIARGHLNLFKQNSWANIFFYYCTIPPGHIHESMPGREWSAPLNLLTSASSGGLLETKIKLTDREGKQTRE